MPIVPIDVTTAGLIKEGQYVATVQSVKYQIKTGEKWNADGTTDTDFDTWSAYGADSKRLHYTIAVPSQGNVFHDLYVMDKALGFVKEFFKKCNAPFSKEGFDPEAPVGKQIGLEIGIKDEPDWGERNTIKFLKAA
jgi:hypothetical protein